MDCHKPPLNVTIPEKCCTATTGCENFDGTLRRVRTEPIFVQKVYDAALFNLQAMRSITNQQFRPRLGPGARIIRVLAIRCKKFFNPANINDPDNLIIDPTTKISGADFVEDGSGCPVTVIGPDGLPSQKILFADTEQCDELGKGTPIFGTQIINISGNVIIEMDVLYTDAHCCEKRATLTANVNIATPCAPLVLTNFFELCMPSVYDSAFLPRLAEFCNIGCQTRLATNSLRDISIDHGGTVSANLLIALCITCEKKIIVPVQLCVLSTGFPVLSADTSPVCSTFPSLFPKQIDKKHHHIREEESASLNEEVNND